MRTLVMLLILLSSSSVFAAQPAVLAAQEWLKTLDRSVEDAYLQAGGYISRNNEKDAWIAKIHKARPGNVQARFLKGTEATENFGVSLEPGEYVLVTFESVVEIASEPQSDVEDYIERVRVQHEDNGAWKVVDYSILPESGLYVTFKKQNQPLLDAKEFSQVQINASAFTKRAREEFASAPVKIINFLYAEALSFLLLNNYDEAEKSAKEAHELWVTHDSYNLLRGIKIKEVLAKINFEKKEYPKTISWQQEAISLFKTDGSSYERKMYLQSAQNLCNVYYGLNQWDALLALQQEMLPVAEREYGASSLQAASIRENLSAIQSDFR